MTHVSQISPAPDSMMPDAALADRLKSLLGAGNVVQDASDRALFSGDIFTQGIVAELVVNPPEMALLAQAVALCTAHGRAVVPRGGGLSYTFGYLPPRAASIVFDLRQLDRIVEINADDMYVTVECGCTWLTLYEALKARGLRTPYFGPASGFSSTIGGALSQGSFLKGSTQHGTTAETTLALDVVLADGTLLLTGSAASMHNPSPFFRTMARTLRGFSWAIAARSGSRRVPPFGSFGSRNMRVSRPTRSTVRRACWPRCRVPPKRASSECHGWDPYVVRAFAARGEGFAADLKYLKGVATSGGSFGKGLLDAVKIAVAGKNIFDETHYLMHAIVEDGTATGADAKFALLQNVAAAQNGRALEPSVPRAIYGTPFTYPNALLGPKGQRWVPVHALTQRAWDRSPIRCHRSFTARPLPCRLQAETNIYRPVRSCSSRSSSIISGSINLGDKAPWAAPAETREEHDRLAARRDIAAKSRAATSYKKMANRTGLDAQRA